MPLSPQEETNNYLPLGLESPQGFPNQVIPSNQKKTYSDSAKNKMFEPSQKRQKVLSREHQYFQRLINCEFQGVEISLQQKERHYQSPPKNPTLLSIESCLFKSDPYNVFIVIPYKH